MVSIRQTLVNLTLVLVVSCSFLNTTKAWSIAPPTKTSDWKQLASLIVNTFDEPAENTSWIERLAWKGFGQSLTIEATYRHYVSTGRKMRGTKYEILVAKSTFDQVIGMAELGIRQANNGECRPTIGVLCVDKKYRTQGIGTALVNKCQDIVQRIWMEDFIAAEVDPENQGTIAFFESFGFQSQPDTRVTVRLRRGRGAVEERGHLLLTRNLTNTSLSFDPTLAVH